MSRPCAVASDEVGPCRRGTRRRSLVALFSGVVLPFAFAPLSVWPLAILAPTALLLWLRHCSAKQAAITGWFFGLGMFGHGVWWIQVSVHQFGVPHYAFSISVTALFVAAMALYPCVFALLHHKVAKRIGFSAALALAPALWVGLEMLRGWLFTGFPWLLLGYSQLDTTFAGYIPVIGIHGVSFIVMTLSAALAWSVVQQGALSVCSSLMLMVGLWMGGHALSAVEFSQPLGPRLQVALIQGAVPQALKWRPEEKVASIALYRDLSLPYRNSDLIIWPETAIPAFPQEIPQVMNQLLATFDDVDVLSGIPTGDPYSSAYYNSVIALNAQAEQYHKHHLVPFGEYFPLKSWWQGLARLLSIPMSDFSAGPAFQAPLTAAGYKVGISICYEAAFAREIARALPDAAFLVNVSNDAWFGDTIAPHQHLQIVRARALETGRYLLRGTNSGISAVIDERGQIQAQAPQFARTVLIGEFGPRQGATPFVRFGDGPIVILGLFSVLAVSLAHWRRAGRHGGA